MDIKKFKRLIKEAVHEVIQEELPDILEEHMAVHNKQSLNENRTLSFTSDNVNRGSLPADVRKSLMSTIGMQMGYDMPPAQPELKVMRGVSDPVTGEPVNPYLAFLQDSAQNMTPQERQGLRNLD